MCDMFWLILFFSLSRYVHNSRNVWLLKSFESHFRKHCGIYWAKAEKKCWKHWLIAWGVILFVPCAKTQTKLKWLLFFFSSFVVSLPILQKITSPHIFFSVNLCALVEFFFFTEFVIQLNVFSHGTYFDRNQSKAEEERRWKKAAIQKSLSGVLECNVMVGHWSQHFWLWAEAAHCLCVSLDGVRTKNRNHGRIGIRSLGSYLLLKKSEENLFFQFRAIVVSKPIFALPLRVKHTIFFSAFSSSRVLNNNSYDHTQTHTVLYTIFFLNSLLLPFFQSVFRLFFFNFFVLLWVWMNSWNKKNHIYLYILNEFMLSTFLYRVMCNFNLMVDVFIL